MNCKHDERLGISISKVREQLEVARALGLVEVKSKTGMKMKSYSFTPAVRLSLFFALARISTVLSYSVKCATTSKSPSGTKPASSLQDEDKQVMRECLIKAPAKLNGKPVRIPNEEHRTFHLTIFKRLDNPFVMGILEAYWDAYDAVELNRYSDYSYFQQVWTYHEQIFEAICKGDYTRHSSSSPRRSTTAGTTGSSSIPMRGRCRLPPVAWRHWRSSAAHLRGRAAVLTAPPRSGVTPWEGFRQTSMEEVFELGDHARGQLVHFLTTAPEKELDRVLTFQTLTAGTVTASKHKIEFPIFFLHGIGTGARLQRCLDKRVHGSVGARPAFEQYRDVDVARSLGSDIHLRRSTYRRFARSNRPSLIFYREAMG